MAGTASIAWTVATNPPVLTLGASGSTTGSGNAISHSITGAPAGCVIVILTSIGLGAGNCTVTSSPSISWTKQADCGDTSTEIHTAVFSAGGSITVTPNWGDPTTACSVYQILTNQEAVLSGASLAVTRSQAPFFGEGCSGDLVSTKAGSIILGVVGDRSNVAGTITYIGTPTQIFAQQSSGPFFYTFYKAAPTITTYTLGMSSPSTGAAMGLCLYEIRTI